MCKLIQADTPLDTVEAPSKEHVVALPKPTCLCLVGYASDTPTLIEMLDKITGPGSQLCLMTKR